MFKYSIALPLLLSVLLGGCASAPVAGELPYRPLQPLPADFQGLQGVWVVVRNEVRTVPITEMAGATFHFRQDRHWFRKKGDINLAMPGGSEQFFLDSTIAPNRIDFDDGQSPRIQAIYKIEGNRLTICSAGPGKPRPTEFGTSLFSDTILVKLERLSSSP